MNIKKSIYGLLVLSVFISLLLISCGGDGGTSTPADTGESGTAKYGTAEYGKDKYN